MHVIYDSTTDTLTLILSEGPIVESDEEKPGIILDDDASGSIVSLEILDASRRVTQPTTNDLRVSRAESVKEWL